MSTELRTVEHRSRRLLIPLPMPYDEAIHMYERLVPVIDRARFGQLATWDAVLALAEINAPFGFMIFWRTDVTVLMAGSQSGWKCVEYLMGNHTIAERMFRHDPSVMLHARCASSSTQTRTATRISPSISRAHCSPAMTTRQSPRSATTSTGSSRDYLGG